MVGYSKPMKNNSTALDLAYIAVFAALICVLGFFAIPTGTGVPLVLQNAAIILAGLVLGARRGTLATALFLLVGLALPVLAGGRTVITALSGPTVGYLVGYLISAAVAGLIAYRAPLNKTGEALSWLGLAGFAALALQYLCGIAGLMVRAGMDVGTAFAAQTPFLLPDTIKTAAAIAIAFAVHRALPQVRSSANNHV
ncbi:Biotin transporter BioY [Corynebacterium aquatimens]|nr:Biotin transporter BioY [Corynebacterium aquatimens]